MLYLFFLFTIFGCSELKEDNPETLPSVNTSNYLYGNYIKFPLNTLALDIYATLNKKFGPGEHSVTGTGWITKTVNLEFIKKDNLDIKVVFFCFIRFYLEMCFFLL